jgi:hypothetical protein
MKKLLLLSALFIFACSSDDNSNNSDPIIGVWNFYLTEYIDQDTNTWVSETDSENGGTYSQTFYENGELLFDFDNGQETYTGVWENLGNNIYRIETNMGYFDGVLYDEEVDVGNSRILFYCDNNLMRWDFGYEDYPRNDQQYMSKGSYNPQDCNEPPYNTN